MGDRKRKLENAGWASLWALALAGGLQTPVLAEEFKAPLNDEAAASGAEAAQAATQEAAQETAGASAENEQNMVMVVARRRTEALQDVPASVAVVTEEQIEREGIYDFQDIALRVPNLLIVENGNNPTRTQVTIRGVPDRAGIFIDDVFVGDASGVNTLLIDIQQVEVLRGPQVTLFGRNALSGAVNTITRKPSDEFEASILARGGSDSYLQFGAAVSGPIIPGRLLGKVAGGWRTQNSFDVVRGVGDNFNQVEEFLLLGQLLWRVTNNFEALASVDYVDNNSVTNLNDVIRDFGPSGQIFRVAATDGNPIDRILPAVNQLNRFGRSNISGYLRLNWDLNEAFTLRSISAARSNDIDVIRDGDNTSFDLISGQQPLKYNQVTQEVTLFYDKGGSINWQAGVYYFSSDSGFVDTNVLGGDFPLNSALGVPPGVLPIPPLVPGGLSGILTPAFLFANPAFAIGATGSPFPAPVLGTQTTTSQQELRSVAVYGSASWRPIESIEVTGGLRFTNERNTASIGRGVEGVLGAFLPAVPTVTFPSATDNELSPSGSISWFATDDVTLYFTAARGFRSGGFNTAPPGGPIADPAVEGAARRFSPERLVSYEAGFKTTLLDGQVLFNAAGFILDYNDFQRSIFRIDPVTGPQSETLNTTASVTGAEAVLQYNPSERFSFNASYGYSNSRYDDYPDAPVNTTGGLVIEDLTGQALPFVPTHSATVGFYFSQPLTERWSFRLTSDAQYRSPYQVVDGLGVDPEIFVGDTIVANASLGVECESCGMSLVGRIFNINNEVYRTGLDFNTFSGAVNQALSAPRTWTLELRKTF